MPASSPPGEGVLARAVKMVGRMEELLLGGLLFAMLGFGLAGVLFRYVLQLPLTWPDELNRQLLIWLTLLGAVVATRQGSHIRFETSVVNVLSGRARFVVETLLDALVVAFLGLLVYWGYQFASLMQTTHLITLRWLSIAWFVSAVPALAAVMALHVVMRRVLLFQELTRGGR